MGWFQQWWQGIGLTGQVMAFMAIPMTVVMLLQTILLVIGFGGDSDMDSADSGDFDADADADDGGYTGNAGSYGSRTYSGIITVRGVVAFFALGGWAGLAALSAGLRPLWSVKIALLVGVLAMLLASAVMKFALRMQSSGNLDLRNAISQTADVYITIPPARQSTTREVT